MNSIRQLTIIFLVLATLLQAEKLDEKQEPDPTELIENLNLITVHAEDAHLPGILAILAKESGFNIVTDPNVNRQDKISIHLDDVPIEQAMNLVVRAVGLSYEVVGNSFLIADP